MEQRTSQNEDVRTPSNLDLLSQIPSLKGKKVKVRKVEQKTDGSYTLRDTTLFVKPRNQDSEPKLVDPEVVEVNPERSAERRRKRTLSAEKNLSLNVFGMKPDRASMTTPRSDNKKNISFERHNKDAGQNEHGDVSRAFTRQKSMGPSSFTKQATHLATSERVSSQIRKSMSEANVFILPPRAVSVLNSEDEMKQIYRTHTDLQKQIVAEQIGTLRNEINSYLNGLEKFFNSRLDAFYDNFSANLELFKRKCHEYQTVETASKTDFGKAKHDIELDSIIFVNSKRNEELFRDECKIRISSTNLEKTLQRRLLIYLAENLENRVEKMPTFGTTKLAKENWNQAVASAAQALHDKLDKPGPFFDAAHFANLNHIGLRWEGHELEQKNNDRDGLKGDQLPAFMGMEITNFESVVLDSESRVGSMHCDRTNYNLATPNAKNRESILIEPDTPTLEPTSHEDIQVLEAKTNRKDDYPLFVRPEKEFDRLTETKQYPKDQPDSGTKGSSNDEESKVGETNDQISLKEASSLAHNQPPYNKSMDPAQNSNNSGRENQTGHQNNSGNEAITHQNADSAENRHEANLELANLTIDERVIRFLNKTDHKLDHVTYCHAENLGGQTIRGVSPYLDTFFAFGDEFYAIFDNATETTRLFGLSGYSLTYVAFLPTTADILNSIDDSQEIPSHTQLVLIAAVRLEDAVPLVIIGVFDDEVQKVLKAFVLPNSKKIDSLIPLKDGQSFLAITDSSSIVLYNILRNDPVKTYDVFQKNGVSIISCCALICRDYVVSYTSDSRVSFFEVSYGKSSEFIPNLETASNIVRVRIVHNSNVITSMQATDSMRLDCIDSAGNIVDLVLYRESDKLVTDIKITPIENQSIEKFALTRLSEIVIEGPAGFMTFLSQKENCIGIYDFSTKSMRKFDYSDLLEGFTNSDQSFFILPFRGEKVEILACTPQAIRKIEIR